MAAKKKISEFNELDQFSENDQVKSESEENECVAAKVYGDTVVFSLNGADVQSDVKGCKVGSTLVVVTEYCKNGLQIISVKRR